MVTGTQTCTASPVALPVRRGMLQLCLPRADGLQGLLVLNSSQLFSQLLPDPERNGLKAKASFLS